LDFKECFLLDAHHLHSFLFRFFGGRTTNILGTISRREKRTSKDWKSLHFGLWVFCIREEGKQISKEAQNQSKMGEVPLLQEGKEHFRYSQVTWESDRESKRQISDLQYPKIRRYEAVDGLSFIAQINDFGTRELIGRQKDRILPDCFLQKKRHEKVVWIFPPGHTVSSFRTIEQVLG
jgi:hypothetical protein